MSSRVGVCLGASGILESSSQVVLVDAVYDMTVFKV